MKAAPQVAQHTTPLSARELTILIGHETCKHNVADL